MSILSLDSILGIKWKIGTVAFGAATLVLGVQCWMLSSQVAHTTKLLKQCDADLVTSRNNATALQFSITDQNAKLDALSADSAKRLSDAAAALAAAQKGTKQAEKRSVILLNGPLTGSTLERRVLEVDAKVLESIK
jgi:hypothetical protein